jgi:hypothetical protein
MNSVCKAVRIQISKISATKIGGSAKNFGGKYSRMKQYREVVLRDPEEAHL